MGAVLEQKSVKLVASIIYKNDTFLELAEKAMVLKYGPIENISKFLPFDYTDYYFDEFGSGLKRKLICFDKLAEKKDLYKVKLFSNSIEKETLAEGKRQVNVDPGYITEGKLVLLTTKDYTHRVYLSEGIFAESTLHFKDGAFHSWPWTYPDYSTSAMKEYFEEVRSIYIRDLKEVS